jgi:glycosyltransferase involved in cell wall biosynthesis
MKVGIYIGSSGSAVGGADLSAAVLAGAMAPLHQVSIMHHNHAITKQQLSEFAGVDLVEAHLQFVERKREPFGHSKSPWGRYREARDWSSELSAPYDLFINFTHLMPAFCHAPKGVLVVLFPWFNRREVWPWKSTGSNSLFLRDQLLRTYYDWEWKKRFATYEIKMANSLYTKNWARAWWGIDCEVVYPPMNCKLMPARKNDIILSVGRFTTDGHGKKQSEMMKTFDAIGGVAAPDWEYHCVGGLGTRKEDQRYFDEVQCIARGLRACVRANLRRQEVEELYGRAKIFWHAAGYGEDQQAHPELQEHFGITTVEAMAAGCVPVVVNRGGQPEIVQHGVNGFLWNSLEELKDYTLQLIQDESLRARMSESARVRAHVFSGRNFVNDFLKLCGLANSHSFSSLHVPLSA